MQLVEPSKFEDKQAKVATEEYNPFLVAGQSAVSGTEV